MLWRRLYSRTARKDFFDTSIPLPQDIVFETNDQGFVDNWVGLYFREREAD